MKRRAFLLVSALVLAAMPVPNLNLGYVQAQTPGQLPMFDPGGAPGVCNADIGVECVDSNITQDASGRVFVGRTSPITGSEVFGVRGTAGPNIFTGMYIDGTDVSSWPFYGYSTNGQARAWHYFDGASNQWRLNNNGDRIAVLSTGQVFIGRTSPITSAEVFGVRGTAGPNIFTGMYIDGTNATSLPFYGYSTNGQARAYHYYDGQTGQWRLYNNGDHIAVLSNGNVGIGTTDPGVAKLRVVAPGLGVFATGTNNNGVAGESINSSGVYGITQNPLAAGVFASSANASPTNLGLAVAGRFTATGTKNAVVPLDDGQHVLLTAEESTEVWFSDYGTAHLVHGRAVVQIDPVFLQTVDTAKDYHVFLTARGNPRGSLYIDNETPSSFEIRETTGTANIKVSYRIVAKRKDFAAERLKRVPSSYAHAEPPISVARTSR